MTEKEINQARILYQKHQTDKKTLLAKKEQLEELKKSPDVIKFLELLQYDEEKILSDDEIIDIAFFCAGFETKENKNIYVYKGSYPTTITKMILTKNISSNTNYYNEYQNIETEKIIHIAKNEISNFEKENIIINLLEDDSIEKDESFYMKIYHQIRREYFELLIDKTQEEAISYIKNKSYNVKKRKFK